MLYPYRTLRRVALCLTAGSLLSVANAAPKGSPRQDIAQSPPVEGPAVRGETLILAPGARPFVRGSAPNVWVQDAAPSPASPARAAFRSSRGDAAARGFYTGRMTYLMPSGRCVSAPAKLSSWKAPRPAARPAKPAAKRVSPARAAPKGGRS
ncbi:MAG TPA: hypothetical protein VGM37_06815 [Armatimonadota bacterium]